MSKPLKHGIARISLAFAVLVVGIARGAVATESALACKLSEEVIDRFIQAATRVPKPTRDEVWGLMRKGRMDRLRLWLDLEAVLGGVATMQYGGRTREVVYWITDGHIVLVTADDIAPENSVLDRTTGRLHLVLSSDWVLPYECEKQPRRF